MRKREIKPVIDLCGEIYSKVAEICRELSLSGHIVLRINNDIHKFHMFDYDFKYDRLLEPTMFKVISLNNKQNFTFNLDDIVGGISWELHGTDEEKEKHTDMLKGALVYAGYAEYK